MIISMLSYTRSHHRRWQRTSAEENQEEDGVGEDVDVDEDEDEGGAWTSALQTVLLAM